jgi:hypothetical protein
VLDRGQRELELVVGGFDGDVHARSEASESLLDELSLLDFDRLDRLVGVERPAGTRAAGAATVGTLVGIFSSPIVLRAAMDVVRSWLMRQEGAAVTVKCGKDSISLAAATPEEQRALVEMFVEKHSRS